MNFRLLFISGLALALNLGAGFEHLEKAGIAIQGHIDDYSKHGSNPTSNKDALNKAANNKADIYAQQLLNGFMKVAGTLNRAPRLEVIDTKQRDLLWINHPGCGVSKNRDKNLRFYANAMKTFNDKHKEKRVFATAQKSLLEMRTSQEIFSFANGLASVCSLGFCAMAFGMPSEVSLPTFTSVLILGANTGLKSVVAGQNADMLKQASDLLNKAQIQYIQKDEKLD